nr:UPF0236 family protein [Finegoldia magna]
MSYTRNSRFVLDKYHFMKEVIKVSANEPRHIELMYNAVYSFKRNKVKDMLEIFTNSGICAKDDADSFYSYYSNNYNGIKIWQSLGPARSGSCAEGLVSHTPSSRLSSRPCAWSYRGLDDVSRLRVHLLNGDEIKPSDFDFLIETDIPIENLAEIRQNKRQESKKEFEFSPLVTAVFQRSKRDSLYRFFQSITDGGYKY